jgi:predicted  nucleic acid-binding Zn-ribbon protein
MFRRKRSPEPTGRPAGIEVTALTDAELAAEVGRLEAAAQALEGRLREVDSAIGRAAQNRDGAEVDRLGRLEASLTQELETVRAKLEALRAEQARRAEARRREWEQAFEAWAGPWGDGNT